MVQRAALLIVLCGAAVLQASPAWGCSCTLDNTKEKYDKADAAFIGTVESKTANGDEAPGAGRIVYTYVVEETFKRDVGKKIEVATANDSAMCGYDAPVGARHAMVLYDQGRDSSGRYSAGYCSFVDANELRQAAKGEPKPPNPPPNPPDQPQPDPPVVTPQPPPPPQPPAGALLVAGRFGSARLLLLDGAGKTLTRGIGRGRTLDVAVCGGRVAELALVNGQRRLVVRRLPSLSVISNRRANRVHGSVDCVRGRAVSRAFRGEDAPVRPVSLGTTRYAVRDARLVRGNETIRRFDQPPVALLALPVLARASAVCPFARRG